MEKDKHNVRIQPPECLPKTMPKDEWDFYKENINNSYTIVNEQSFEAESLLDGLLYCGKCNKTMIKARWVSKKGLKERFLYICKGARNRYCSNKNINERYLNSYILELVNDVLSLDNEIIIDYIEEIRNSEINMLRGEIDNLLDDYDKPSEIEQSDYKHAIDSKIETNKREIDYLSNFKFKYRIDDIKTKCKKLLSSDKLSDKRDALFTLISSIEVKDDEIITLFRFSSFVDNYNSVLLKKYVCDRTNLIKKYRKYHFKNEKI